MLRLRTAFAVLPTCLITLGTLTTMAHAAAIVVNETADELNTDGDCSLREAVQAANTDMAVDGCAAGSGADVITVPAGTYTLSIPGSDDLNANGDLDLVSDIELIGAGSANTILDGGGIDRVIDARCTLGVNWWDGCVGVTTIHVSGFTIRNGNASGRGGGFRNTGRAGPNATTPVTLLENCHVTMNTSSSGGGVGDEGVLTVRHAVIDHNTGGGVDTFGVTTIEDSTIADNSGSSVGGGISNNGKMFVRRTLISGNSVTELGAGYLDLNGDSVLENVTVVGNTVTNTSGGTGAGIACGDAYNGGSITISHSTIAGNSSATNSGAGGIAVVAGSGGPSTLNIKNSIIADNGSIDTAGVFTSNDYNLVQNVGPASGFSGVHDQLGVDPQLQALADHGGPTHTLALLSGTAAVDSGSCTDNAGTTVSEDQRGQARPAGSTCDIGAFEYAPVVVLPPTLITVANEAAGAHCAAAGLAVTQWLDLDGNGALDSGETASTQYVCNGLAGDAGVDGMTGLSGYSTLVESAPLAVADVQCPTGGVQLDIGLDNGDGQGTARDSILQSGEVDATRYVCNGVAGTTGTTGTTGTQGPAGPEGAQGPAGQQGAQGVQGPAGQQGAQGPAGEQGEQGAQGDNGAQGAQGPAGEQGTPGAAGPAGEQGASGEQGEEGATGEQGASGPDGKTSLVRSKKIQPSETCPDGGVQVESGIDDNGDGALDDDEVDNTATVCLVVTSELAVTGETPSAASGAECSVASPGAQHKRGAGWAVACFGLSMLAVSRRKRRSSR